MKRGVILILVVLLSGIAALAGVKSNVEAIAKGSSGGAADPQDEAGASPRPSVRLRLSHDTVEPGSSSL